MYIDINKKKLYNKIYKLMYIARYCIHYFTYISTS